MFVGNRILLLQALSAKTIKLLSHWAFRFEVMIGSSFIWANQVVWYFSDPSLEDVKQTVTGFLPTTTTPLRGLFPYSHTAGIALIAIDYVRCGEETYRATTFDLIELGCLVLWQRIFYVVTNRCVQARQRDALDARDAFETASQRYGTCEAGQEKPSKQ